MSASLQPPRIDRPGVVYVVAEAGVDLERGPFKIGESGRSAESRLRSNLTFQHPDHPLDVFSLHQCFDRAWVEAFAHRELAPYRCDPPEHWRSTSRRPEWFRCSDAEVRRVMALAMKADALHRAQAERAVACSRAAATASVDAGATRAPIKGSWLISVLRSHRLRGQVSVGEMSAHALATDVGLKKYGGKLNAAGFKCVPLERFVILRLNSGELDSLMRKLGILDWKTALKNIAGFDNDGNPLSLREVKKRCAGYEHQALFA